MDVAAAGWNLGVPLLLISAALFSISTNIARLAKALEARKEDKPKLQV